MKKVYLGDGVYVQVDGGYQLMLTTENGIERTNVICLEPEVFNALVLYAEQVWGKRK